MEILIYLHIFALIFFMLWMIWIFFDEKKKDRKNNRMINNYGRKGV